MASDISFRHSTAPPLPLRRFSVEQYHRLGEMGVLTPDDRVELLEGWIVEKMKQRPIRGFIVRWLNAYFLRQLPLGWMCQCQLPITTERSEPEPDLAILKGEHSDFRDRHPRGTDCRLVIEVADTALTRDRAKADIYRDAGVSEYWIINVAQRQVERYVWYNPTDHPERVIITHGSQLDLALDQSVLSLPVSQLFD